MKKNIVASYGELLVKHTVYDLDSINSLNKDYYQNKRKFKIKDSFGGTEANVLIALNSIGCNTRYASAIGNENLSKQALNILQNNGIDTNFIERCKYKLGEYYYLNDSKKSRSKSTKYYRKGSAINRWNITHFDFSSFFKDVKIFHTSGISFSLDNKRNGIAYKNGFRFIKEAKKRNINVSFDINYRPSIWLDEYNDNVKALTEFKKAIMPILKYVNILFLSSLDLKYIFNFNDSFNLQKVNTYFKKKFPNIKLLVIRNRDKTNTIYNYVESSIIYNNKIYSTQNSIPFPVKEPLGGGDAFDAGIICGILKYNYKDFNKILNYATKLFISKHQIYGDYIIKKKLDIIMNKMDNKKRKMNILITVDNLKDQDFINMKKNLSMYAKVDIKKHNIKSIAGYDIYVGKFLSEELLQTSDRLKAVFAYKTGVDQFPFKELKKRNIDLFNTHSNASTIAQYALALLISLVSRITEFDRKMRKGIWYDDINPYWSSIDNMKIGLLGYGHIGKEINIILNYLKIPSYTIKRSKDINKYKNINVVKNLDELVEKCDAIIASLPETKETKNILNKKILNKMKNKYLVNIGRNSLVKDIDLYDALAKNKLAGAAIDTWEYKPKVGSKTKMLPSNKANFHKLDNIVLSPHQAIKTKDGHTKYILDTEQNIINYILGNKTKNKIDLTKQY